MMPRTLLVRTFLLVSLALIITVATWLALFRLAEREPRAQQLAQLTASVVNLTRAALLVADPARRRELLFELVVREAIHVYPMEPGDTIEPLPDTAFHRLFMAETRARLGDDTRLAVAVNGEPGLWASFRLDEGAPSEEDEFWVVLPLERAQRQTPWYWLAWGLASLGLALAVTLLIVSRITRPLRLLAARAAEVGQGRHPEPLAEAGSLELRQLARAFNQMAEDLRRNDAERAEVLAGISHDLRTPLARLRLEAELSVTDEAARTAIHADIDQMDAVIGQFLDFARGEGNETAQATDVGDLLRRIAASRQRRGHQFAIELPAEAPLLAVRPQALARALANLADNALKYGAGPITLRLAQEDGEWGVEVLDHGPGIPPDEVERLKRPFTRRETARTDARGTGLGLAIVERIARLHGAPLELLPRDGGGLRARIRLRGVRPPGSG